MEYNYNKLTEITENLSTEEIEASKNKGALT